MFIAFRLDFKVFTVNKGSKIFTYIYKTMGGSYRIVSFSSNQSISGHGPVHVEFLYILAHPENTESF
jgi:hypothetical protein